MRLSTRNPRTRVRTPRLGLAALAVTFALLGAIAPSTAGPLAVTAAHADATGTATFSDLGQVTTLNPFQEASTTDSENISAIMPTGLGPYYGPNGTLQPGMLQEIPSLANGQITPDGLTYTFHLIPGLEWSDGSAITANDVALAWHVEMDANTASGFSWCHNEGPIGCGEIASMNVGNATTFTWTLSAPDSDSLINAWPGMLPSDWAGTPGLASDQATINACIADDISSLSDCDAIAQRLEDDPTFNYEDSSYVTAGPYKVQAFNDGNNISYVPNPDYTSAAPGGTPKLANLNYHAYSSVSAMLSGAAAHQTDVANVGQSPGATNLAQADASAGNSYQVLYAGATYGEQLVFNVSDQNPQIQLSNGALVGDTNPVASPNPLNSLSSDNGALVRDALSLAISRAGYLQSLYGISAGEARDLAIYASPLRRSATTPVPFSDPSITGIWDPVANGGNGAYVTPGTAQAVADAQTLLSNAGYPSGLSIYLSTTTTSRRTPEVNYIRNAWNAIGVTTNIERMSGNALLNPYSQGGALASGQFEAGIYAFSGSPATASVWAPDFLSNQCSRSSGQDTFNYSCIDDAAVDSALNSAATELDPGARQHEYNAFSQAVARNNYWTPLQPTTNVWTTDGKVTGIEMNPFTSSGVTWNVFDWSVGAQTQPSGTATFSDVGGASTLNPFQNPFQLGPAADNINAIMPTGLGPYYGPNGTLQPGMLQEVPTLANGGISSDGLTYTFRITPGLRWSDGSFITANDVVLAWHVEMDGNTANGSWCQPTSCGEIASMNVVNATTFTWTLSAPDSDSLINAWPGMLPSDWAGTPGLASDQATINACIADDISSLSDCDAIAQRLEDDPTFNYEDASYVTAGPYQVQAFNDGNNISYVPNPDYTSAAPGGTPKLANLNYHAYSSVSALLAGAAAHQTNVANVGSVNGGPTSLSTLPLADASAGNSYQVLYAGGADGEQLTFNVSDQNPQIQLSNGTLVGDTNPVASPNPLNSLSTDNGVLVRDALSLALSRTGFLQSIFGISASEAQDLASYTSPLRRSATTPVPFSDAGITGIWDPVANGGNGAYVTPGTSQAVADAQTLLSNAGYPSGLSIYLSTTTSTIRTAEVNYIRNAWSAIGVTTNIERMNGSRLLNQYSQGGALAHGQYEAAIFANGGAPPNPTLWDASFLSNQCPRSSGQDTANLSCINDAAVDNGLTNGAVELDPAARQQDYNDFSREVAQNNYWTPLQPPTNVWTTDSQVNGVEMNPFTTPPTWNVFDWSVGTPTTGSTIAGRTIDSSGNGVQGNLVQACNQSGICLVSPPSDASGAYTITNVPNGSYTLTAWPSDAAYTSPHIGPVSVSGSSIDSYPNNDITLQGTTPIPAAVQVTGTGATGQQVNGQPVVFWNSPWTLTAQCPTGNTVTFEIDGTDSNTGLPASVTGNMQESGGSLGTYFGTVPPLNPIHGQISINITCTPPSGSPTHLDFNAYVDPSGKVVDANGNPVPGATVTLLQSDSASGPFTPVPNGSTVMDPSNRNNPDTTDANGRFGWNVLAGYYEVAASENGCTVTSAVLKVPPPALNLVIPLGCAQTISFDNPGNASCPGGPGPCKTYGDDDFTLAATATSGFDVTYTAAGNCTMAASSTVHITGAGLCTLTASQAGAPFWQSAQSVSQTFTIYQANQTIAFGALADATYGDPSLHLSAVATSGLPVSFAAGPAGVCNLEGDGLTLDLVGAGTCSVTAGQNGNANYNPASAVTHSFNIAKANQTISFGALANKTYGDPNFSVSATASSGLPVSFTVGITDNCTISGTTVHITGAGTCTVTAGQSGNGTYNAAAPVSQTFSIGKAGQTIAFAPLADRSLGSGDFALSATASSGLPVGFAASGSCSIVGGNTVHLIGAGTCTIVASQSGNNNYSPATSVSRSFTISLTAAVLYVLSPSGSKVASTTGGGCVTAAGDIYVDSTSANAISQNGPGCDGTHGFLATNGGRIYDAGGSSANCCSPTPVSGSAPDPLATVTMPTFSGGTWYVNGVAQSVYTALNSGAGGPLNPGVYAGGIKLTGGSWTLRPGAYIMDGGGFTVTGSASVGGNGVLIYNSSRVAGQCKGFAVTGSGAISLTGLGSGPLAGLVMAQDRTCSQGDSFSGSSSIGLSGAVYLPSAALTLTGSSSLDVLHAIVISNSLGVTGGGFSLIKP